MAASAFLRLEWINAGTREAIAFAIQTLDGAPLPETTRAAEVLERHGGDIVLSLDIASIVTART